MIDMEEDSLQIEAIPLMNVEYSENPEIVSKYLKDESSALLGYAERVYFPKSSPEISEVLKEAANAGVKITASGAGSSVTGARVPRCGGWVLSMEKFRRVSTDSLGGSYAELKGRNASIGISTDARRALVPPGLSLLEISEMLAPLGLVYPPDPTESSAMLGGTAATNASGARTYKYGPTRNWIAGAEIIIPGGEILHLHRKRECINGRRILVPEIGIDTEFPASYPCLDIKNAAGLYLRENMDLIDLFVGCEGILGIFGEIEIKLLAAPKNIFTCVFFFQEADASLDFVDRLIDGTAGVQPLCIEFFDGKSLDFMRSAHPSIPSRQSAALLLEIEYDRPSQHNPYPYPLEIERLAKTAGMSGSSRNWAAVGRDVLKMKAFRHSLPESVNSYVKTRAGKLGTDMAVPRKSFRQFFKACSAAEDCGVKTVCFGHIGNSHLHLNFLPENKEELEKAKAKYLDLAELAVSLGGTISAEHGVGKKTVRSRSGETIPYLELMLGKENMQAIRNIKSAFDPACILNPGNMIC